MASWPVLDPVFKRYCKDGLCPVLASGIEVHAQANSSEHVLLQGTSPAVGGQDEEVSLLQHRSLSNGDLSMEGGYGPLKSRSRGGQSCLTPREICGDMCSHMNFAPNRTLPMCEFDCRLKFPLVKRILDRYCEHGLE